ncbi:hypothetical protein [Helicobacter pylori]|uniref:hypothetical protein n=1 Tax=Helicobacter pylori TaxID=210 RepID=UPI001ABB9A67|nr:hypothetical protein [Helicobacter pylori]WRE18311.1 hypothetical protein KVE44_03125 [Helicobacter pylori]
MRQRNETATSFKMFSEITQAIRAQKNSPQTSDNANTSEITSQSTPKPKGTARTKNSALKPTKRAFSERQRITRLETTHKQAQKKSKGGR